MFNKVMLMASMILGLYSGASVSSTLQLNPKETQSLTNPYAWTLNATCHIHGKALMRGAIRVRLLNHEGIINGHHLSKGQATSLRVHENEQVSVAAEPGTTVVLVNLGDEPVQAVCST
jgi:hypothetical protein